MSNKARAKGLAVLSGSPSTGQSVLGYDLAERLAGRHFRTLCLDLRFPRENYPHLEGQPFDFDYHSPGVGDLFERRPGGEPDFDMIRLRLPANPTINENLIERISSSIDEFSSRYDSIIISAPSGMNPVSFLVAGICEDIVLIIEPGVSSIASAYCILKTLAAEGLGEKAATVFSNVDTAEQAFSLKDKFDSLTVDFLNLKLKDGGYILSCRENGSAEYTKTSGYTTEVCFETFQVFQNETDITNLSGTASPHGEPDDLKLLTHK